MIALEFHTPQPTAAVLAALRARAGEWRESHILPELRRAGIIAIDCDIQGSTCVLRYERRWYGVGAAGQYLRARATAEPESPGTHVRVLVECHVRNVRLMAMGAGFATVIFVVGFGPVAFSFLAIPLSVLGLTYLRSRASTRTLSRHTDWYADYLARRIEDAVAGPSQPSQVSALSNRGDG